MTYKSSDYRNDFKQVQDDATWTAKRVIVWLTILFVVLSVVGFVVHVASQPARIIEKVTDADNVITNYEQFQEIYNTCQQLNRDLCNIKDVPDTDKMFQDFSKAQRINALRMNMNRWIEEYNGKSKMITRSSWKSSALPYQLDSSNFSCY